MVKNSLKQNVAFFIALFLSIGHLIFAYFVIPKFIGFYTHFHDGLPRSLRLLEAWRIFVPILSAALVPFHLLVKPTEKKFWFTIGVIFLLGIFIFVFPFLIFLPMWNLAQ